MLSIVTGPFHPDLENALVAEVHSLKQDDPLRPLAIVVPSHQLARRVKWLLSVEQGRSLLECHVLTFHQLAMTVLWEAGGEILLALVNGVFGEELLRDLVDRALRLADPDELAALAMERVAHSAFLNRMARICYYGFYDLTQGQLDFFKAVAGAYPTTLFFPVRPESSAYRFAQRFFETYIQ